MLSVAPRFSQALVETARRLQLVTNVHAPSGNDRVALDTQDTLWSELVKQSTDPLIGLQLALNLQVGHLDLTGLLLMSCETLRETFETLLEYLPLIGQGGDVALEPQSELLRLSYQPHYTCCQAQRVELALACTLQLARWSTDNRFRIQRISFRHAPLDEPERYQALLQCPVQFEAAENSLLFHSSELDHRLIQANPALRDQLSTLADQSLRELGDHSVSAQVANALRSNPRSSKEDIARQLALSGRHLARCLVDEGFSFRQLRDRELEALAREALQRGDKVTAISYDLGFSDDSAFAKAFRRWTGLSPSQFREQ